MLIIVFGRKRKMEIRLHRLGVKLHRNEASDESSFVTWTWVAVTHINIQCEMQAQDSGTSRVTWSFNTSHTVSPLDLRQLKLTRRCHKVSSGVQLKHHRQTTSYLNKF